MQPRGELCTTVYTFGTCILHGALEWWLARMKSFRTPQSTLVHRARPHSHHARLCSCGPSGCILVLNMGLLLEMRNLLGLLILHTLMRDFLCFDGTSAYDSTDDAGPVSMSKTAR